jgi:protein tyrosine phosphatase type 4A
VLVAIALIEGGLDPIAAVNFLRERRRGAINNKQLTYLESYRRRNRAGCVCTIM